LNREALREYLSSRNIKLGRKTSFQSLIVAKVEMVEIAIYLEKQKGNLKDRGDHLFLLPHLESLRAGRNSTTESSTIIGTRHHSDWIEIHWIGKAHLQDVSARLSPEGIG
jgi:hypothetical protein